MTTRQAIALLKQRLSPLYGDGEATAMTRMAFETYLRWTPVDMVLHEADELPPFVSEKMEAVAARVAAGEPIQYVLGVARFHGHNFKVTPAVLIPRPETEQLVDLIVSENTGTDLRVLDLGTGSGCIAVSLARALKFAQVTAVDISEEALAVARDNAAALKVRVRFERADILTLRPAPASLDIVVSNPPYVCRSEAATMEPHVLRHEPHTALFVPDDDPLRHYRAILPFAAAALVPGGRLYLEVNRRYGGEVASLARGGGFDDVRLLNDFAGNPRFVAAVTPA